jgi:hypothetical protein
MACPAWPDWTRRIHAWSLSLMSANAAGSVRVEAWPSWWQPTQPRFPMRLTQSSRLMFFGIFEVPPNSVASGIFNIEYQWMAG